MKTNEIFGTINKLELEPINGRASFYGKAYVTKDGDKLTLYSYGQKICSVIAGEIAPICTRAALTLTTRTHLKAFITRATGHEPTKKEWNHIINQFA